MSHTIHLIANPTADYIGPKDQAFMDGRFLPPSFDPELYALGGAPNFLGRALAVQGLAVNLYAPTTEDHPYNDILRDAGINVIPLCAERTTGNTVFYNGYTVDPKTGLSVRKQHAHEPLEGKVTAHDLEKAGLTSQIREDDIAIFAPVSDIIDEEALEIVAGLARRVIYLPQGGMRFIDPETGEVSMYESGPLLKAAHFVSHMIYSDEDVAHASYDYKRMLLENSATSILTRGERGSTIFGRTNEYIHIGAFALSEEEKATANRMAAEGNGGLVFSGLGESYASGVINALLMGKDIIRAGLEGSMIAHQRMLNGIAHRDTVIPTPEQIAELYRAKEGQMREYYADHGVTYPLIEGGRGQIER